MTRKPTHASRSRRPQHRHGRSSRPYGGNKPAPWLGNNRCKCLTCSGAVGALPVRAQPDNRRDRRRVGRILEKMGVRF